MAAVLLFAILAAILTPKLLQALLKKNRLDAETWGADDSGYYGSSSRFSGEAEGLSPAPPPPVICAYCGSSYMPAETARNCPNCGAAKPLDSGGETH